MWESKYLLGWSRRYSHLSITQKECACFYSFIVLPWVGSSYHHNSLLMLLQMTSFKMINKNEILWHSLPLKTSNTHISIDKSLWNINLFIAQETKEVLKSTRNKFLHWELSVKFSQEFQEWPFFSWRTILKNRSIILNISNSKSKDSQMGYKGQ